MLSKWTIIALAAGLYLANCTEKSASGHDVELLTGTPWKYEQAGIYTDDADEDANFDALDPRIAGCEKNNSVVFHSDGTGSDNLLPFVWSLQNNDSTIYFQDRYYKVKTLSDSRLIMYADQKLGKAHTRYTIVLKH